MQGTTVEMALSCAMKVKRGEYCTPDELRASLDTLAFAYKKAKPTLKRVYRKTRSTVSRSKNKGMKKIGNSYYSAKAVKDGYRYKR